MVPTTNSSPAPPSRQLPAVLATVLERARAAWTALATSNFSRHAFNRRILYRLSVLSDRELEDIGLTRFDLTDAALPENGDATHFLVARQHHRRSLWRSRSPF